MEQIQQEKKELLENLDQFQKERDELIDEKNRLQKEYEQERESGAQLRKDVQVGREREPKCHELKRGKVFFFFPNAFCPDLTS